MPRRTRAVPGRTWARGKDGNGLGEGRPFPSVQESVLRPQLASYFVWLGAGSDQRALRSKELPPRPAQEQGLCIRPTRCRSGVASGFLGVTRDLVPDRPLSASYPGSQRQTGLQPLPSSWESPSPSCAHCYQPKNGCLGTTRVDGITIKKSRDA